MNSQDLLPTDYQETLSLLEDIFELDLPVYYSSGTWKSCQEGEESIEPARLDFFDKEFDAYQPVTLFQRGAAQFVALSIPVEGKQVVALAQFEEQSKGLNERRSQKFAKAAERLLAQAERSNQTTPLCEELSGLMEETTWLRNISQYVRMCDVSNKSDNMVRSMLPRLQEMVKSKSIGFLTDTQSGLQDTWLGEECSFDPWDLIDAHSSEARTRPVVINNHSYGRELGFPRSYVLVHVGSEEEHYGWIVALNRLEQHSLVEETGFSITGVLEFGTSEAGLIQAAADLLSTHARNSDLYEARQQLFLGVIRAMSDAVDARDPYTKGHSDRVASYAKAIAEEMGFDQEFCKKIHLTGLLHDIGKIGIPDRVLNKQGKLTDEEYSIIKKHPQIGHNILSHLKDLAFVLPGVLHHHERADGRGYPHGLTAEQNSMDANILAVADAFDAMTSTRSYRPGMSLEKAKSIIEEEIGAQFAPEPAAAFMKAWPAIVKISGADTRRCEVHRDASDLLMTQAEENPSLGSPLVLATNDA